MTSKKEILDAYDNQQIDDKRNRMGCLESWYVPSFAISHTFSKEEVEKMDDKTIDLLVRLADSIGGALY